MHELYLHVVAYVTNNFNRIPKIKFTLTLSKKKIDTENYFNDNDKENLVLRVFLGGANNCL